MSKTNEIERVIMFFLYKKGVYGHGIFWIGSNLEEGKREADKAASLDRDNYHDWVLFEFTGQEYYKLDADHKEIYRGKRI